MAVVWPAVQSGEVLTVGTRPFWMGGTTVIPGAVTMGRNRQI